MVLKYYLSFLFFSVLLCCDILKQTSPSDYMKIKEKLISLNYTKCIYESLKSGNYYQTEKYLMKTMFNLRRTYVILSIER